MSPSEVLAPEKFKEASSDYRGEANVSRREGAITTASFIDRKGRRVLAKSGQPGMDGREGIGSTTELILASFASHLADWPAGVLNGAQYDDLARWVEMARDMTWAEDMAPASFVDRNGRGVLADSGAPGMKGEEGIGSSTEKTLGVLASMLAQNRARQLDSAQYDDLLRWVVMCRTAALMP
ncbi:hypothetical protein [Herbaspirillum robiniae]|uniref:hypothetical protein n=1 Tax=Herbaspirillum robiniae TaxID=2014887 RepID=UPI0011E4CDE7|nr:hypothetical protein [Herbaspirillum robiniae]